MQTNRRRVRAGVPWAARVVTVLGVLAAAVAGGAAGTTPAGAAPVLVPVAIDAGTWSENPAGSRWHFHNGANASCLSNNSGFAIEYADLDPSTDALPGTGVNVLTDGMMLFDPAPDPLTQVPSLYFEPNDTVDVTTGQLSTVTTSVAALGPLNVSLQHAAMSDANRLRTLYTFANPSDTPVTHRYELRSDLGSGAATGVRGSSSGDTTWTTSDRWLVTSGAATSAQLTDAALTTALYGPGSGVLAPTAVSWSCSGPNPNPSQGRQVTTWDVTVPAHSTRSLAFFSELHPTNEGAVATAATTYDPTTFATSPLFADLAPTVRAGILNWKLAPAPSTAFHAVVPYRVLDSRSDVGGWGAAKLGPGATRSLAVAGTGGAGGVPASATAVVMNMTATEGTQGSFVTVFPAGSARAAPSNLNFAASETIPNLATTALGAGGALSIYNAVGSVHLVADVVGYFDDGSGPGDLFNGIAPVRVLDSRTATGGWNATLGPGATRPLTVRGPGTGVPDTASAVVMNVTSTNATAGSFLRVWPTGAPPPVTSNLNFAPGQTIANLVTVQVGAGGSVSILNAVGSTDVVADITGYFDAAPGGGRFHPINPVRIQESRPPAPKGHSPAWGPGESWPVPVAGSVPTIPVGATGVILNVTVTGGTAGSLLKVFPDDGAGPPTSSTINFAAGQTIPNLTMLRLPPNGQLAVYNQQGSVDVIGDAAGYFALT